MSQIEVIRAVSLGGLAHGFLGRRGGVSTGALAGLNVGYGSKDDRAAIDQNRLLAISAILPDAPLATVHQVHSPDVVQVEEPWAQEDRPRADAMVTDRPYSAARDFGSAIDELRRCAGSQFDPGVVEAFIAEVSRPAVPLRAVDAA